MGRARPLALIETSKRTETEGRQVIELYRQLDNADAVAAELGISPGRVRRRLREAGTSVRVLQVERAAAIFTETGNLEITAQQVGVSVASARRRLEAAALMKLIDAAPPMPHRELPRRSGRGPLDGRAPQRLHPEIEAATIALYEELRSLRKVAARLGLTQEGVRQRLLNAGYALDRSPRITAEEEHRALDLYREMRSVLAVAAQMGRAPLTIKHALERRGVDIDRRNAGAWNRQLSETRLNRKIGEARVLHTLYRRLGSEKAVASLVGCSHALVSKRLQLIGAAPGRGRHGRRGPRDPKLAQQIVELYESGVSARQAALRVGVQPYTAILWLRAAGYDTSKSARASGAVAV